MSKFTTDIVQLTAIFHFLIIFFSGSVYIPPNRLLNLLRQAVAYQIEVSRYHPRISPIVDTLLEDFSPFVIPNATRTIMQGHRGNVKCAEFLGSEGRSIISGSRYYMTA